MTPRILMALALNLLSVHAMAQQTASGFDTTNNLPLIFANQGQKVGEWNSSALVAQGGVQVGQTSVICDATTAGQMRWNPATVAFEGCNGSSWQSLGGGPTIVEGGCQTYWSSCPAGYRATSYFSPGTYNCCDRCGNPAWRYTVCSQ